MPDRSQNALTVVQAVSSGLISSIRTGDARRGNKQHKPNYSPFRYTIRKREHIGCPRQVPYCLDEEFRTDSTVFSSSCTTNSPPKVPIISQNPSNATLQMQK